MDNEYAFACTDLESGIRALPNIQQNATTDNGLNSAILRYAGAYVRDPVTQDTSGKNPLVETNLHVRSLFVLGVWGCIDVLFFIFFTAVGAFPCGKKPRSFTNKAV